MKRVALIVPCFNEGHRLNADAFIAFEGRGYELVYLFVDDGSTDDTPRLLETMRRQTDRIRVTRLERNSGKAEAVRRGMLEAIDLGFDLAGYWDADLATPLAELDRFVDVLSGKGVDVAMGSRVKLLGHDIERHVHRHAFGRVFATAVSALLHIDAYDTQCGAKLFRVSSNLREVFRSPFLSRWVFDVEILLRLRDLWSKRGMDPAGRIAEVPLRVWRDVAGSKVGWRDAALAVRDLGVLAARYGAGRGLRTTTR